MKKLNQKGASHIFLLAALLVTVGVGGSFMLVKNHTTQARASTTSGCPSPVAPGQCSNPDPIKGSIEAPNLGVKKNATSHSANTYTSGVTDKQAMVKARNTALKDARNQNPP